MRNRLTFIAYADIHHDEKAARCLTLNDTLQIETDLHNKVVESNFDFSLFAGDRYLKREPHDEVKVRADRVIMRALGSRQQPHYHLVGNHDWVDNSCKWHTAETLEGVATVWKTPSTYFDDELGVAFHVLPSGFQFDKSVYNFEKQDYLNIFVFHDMVRGSVSDDEGKHVFDSGIDLGEIDLPEFDLILAGDIHVPQQFNLNNCKGGYTGAALQRTRADANRVRGWVEVTAVREASGWVCTTRLVPVRNFFTRYTFEVGESTTYSEINTQIDDQWVGDQAVEVKLVGKKEYVDRIAEDPHWANYLTFVNARSFDILREYQSETSDVTVDMSTAHTVTDDLVLYLDSGFADIGLLSRDYLIEVLETSK